MDWPPQNTGLFAVAFCAQCTVAAVDVVEFNFLGGSYGAQGWPRLDGDDLFSYYMGHSLGGSLTSDVFMDGDCLESLGTETYTYAGTCTLDPYSGDVSGGTFVNGEPNGCGDPTSYLTPSGPTEDHYEDTTTATTSTLTGNNVCYPGAGAVYRVTGTVTVSLFNKWDEDVGIAVAIAPGWTGWEAQGQFPDPLESQSAAWEAWAGTKSGGQAYTYHRAQFRRTKNGFNPGAAYDVTMELHRKVYPAGAWALYATITDTITANETGALVWSGEIPIARGYASWVKAASFSAVPAA